MPVMASPALPPVLPDPPLPPLLDWPPRLALSVPPVESEEEPALGAFALDPSERPPLSLGLPVWLVPESRSVVPPQATPRATATGAARIRPTTTDSVPRASGDIVSPEAGIWAQGA
jgi:hypothetical protein